MELLYFVALILGFIVGIAWLIFPFVIISQLGRVIKALERLEWIAQKSDRPKEKADAE